MASIDISQFHSVFFEESFEGLAIMETELLNLDLGAADPEAVNTIFRAAHSIKGGAGTFGFSAIAEFTHVMETLLDEMRSGQREVTREAVDLLLRTVDGLREMMAAVRDGGAHDAARVLSLRVRLDGLLATGSKAAVDPVGATRVKASDRDDTGSRGWRIEFKPYPHMLKTGNDPARMFRELAALSEITTRVDLSRLPAFEALAPEECYLGWELELRGEIDREQITDIFEWVDGDCDLHITPLEDAGAVARLAPATPADSGSPVDERRAERRSDLDPRLGDDRREANERKRPAPGTDSSSIRVSIDKVDALIDLVGELVITQSMLGQFGQDFDPRNLERLRDGLSQLARNTRDLQESVLRIRMLPISFSFKRFPRLVYDLSGKLGKKVELKLSGEKTEIDKTVMERIGDPLVHLVRNSLDHGIESPGIRKAAGKAETGVLRLNAYHEGGNVVIEIADDGAGLNQEKIMQRAKERGLVNETEVLTEELIRELIFHPGFSTAETVSDVSGRGVGLDVVRRNIKSLGGAVEVSSKPGEGSTFTIRLPLTLAILDGQLVRVGQQIYIIPLVSIVESLQVDRHKLGSVAGQAELYKLRDDYLPIIRLYRTFNVVSDNTQLERGLLVVVEGDGRKAGIFVDDLLAQQQVVIKSLEMNYERVPGVSGATILGDGRVALILDVPGLITLSRRQAGRRRFTLVDNTQSAAA